MRKYLVYTIICAFYGLLWYWDDFDTFWGGVWATCALVTCQTLGPAIVKRITNITGNVNVEGDAAIGGDIRK